MSVKDKLFNLKPQVFPVEIEQLGEPLYVRALNAAEMESYGKEAQSGTLESPMSTLALMGTVDEKGDRFFVEEDIERLQQLDARIVKKLAEAIIEASGLSDEQADDLKN